MSSRDQSNKQRHLRFVTIICLVASSLSFTTSHPNQSHLKIDAKHSIAPKCRNDKIFTCSSDLIGNNKPSAENQRRWNSSLKSNNKSDPFEIRGGAAPPPLQPTIQQIIKFAIPCLGLWISGPLLSLVDTATVGLTAKPGLGATQLGALGPATTFIDGATYIFAFLNVATTNLYASAMAANSKDPEASKSAGDAVVRTAVKNSLICGFGVMILLLSASRKLLSVYIGSVSTKVLNPAHEYVNIRALSMPTSLMAGVLQAALLGAKDSVTPLYAVLASTIVNISGDFIGVVLLGMGCKGAALATLAAQWAGTLTLWRPAMKKLFVSKEKKMKKNAVSSMKFLGFAAPVLTLIMGKIAAFGVMTHVAAALQGEATLASHQIVLSLFFFVSPFLEVISQTAQTFLPQFYIGIKDDKYGDSYGKEAQTLAWRLLRLGMCVGAVVAFVAASIPRFFPFLLTNDIMVQESVRPLALPLFLGSVLTAPVAVSEGVLLARRDLKYLASVYLLSTAVFPFALFKIKHASGPVVNIWFGFALFQLFRAVCFTGKLWGGEVLKKIGHFVRREEESSQQNV